MFRGRGPRYDYKLEMFTNSVRASIASKHEFRFPKFWRLDIHEMLSDPGKRFPCRRFDEKTSRIPKFRGIPVHGTGVQKLFEKFSSSRFSSSFLKSPKKCIDVINPFVRRIQARFNRFEIENIDPPPAPPPPLSLPSSAATW